MSDEKPPEKPTVQMERVPEWAVKIQEGVTGLRTDVVGLRADVSIIAETQKEQGQRMLRAEKRQDEFEEWRARASERAKSEEQTRSKVDMEHQAHLVHIEERFKAMTEAQTNTIVSAMTAAAKTPQGQKVLNALVGFIVVALTIATGWLMAHGGAK
jgi:hypothetical protein